MPAETTTTETWTRLMTRLMTRLPEFSSAVLTGLDAQGYPYSVRCRPQLDEGAKTLWMPTFPGAPIQPGPAGLLCHHHDERLWNQRSFLVRGMLTRDGAAWIFQPRQYVEGVGYGGVVGLARFVVGARRAAKEYLVKRGLPRPSIPWDEVIAAKRRAKLPLQLERTAGPAARVALVLGVAALVAGIVLLRRNRGW
jgi:hypothetical protein